MDLVNGHESVLVEEWIHSFFFKIIFEEYHQVFADFIAHSIVAFC